MKPKAVHMSMAFAHLVERWSKIWMVDWNSTKMTKWSSSRTKIYFISEFQTMGLKLVKAKFDIATSGNQFPLKKMWKRWSYILIRPKNGSKKWVVHVKSIYMTHEYNVLMYINSCLICRNNIPRMVAWLTIHGHVTMRHSSFEQLGF